MPIDDTAIPMEYARTLIDVAKEQGCDVAGLLDELNITAAALNDDLYFSAIKYGQLYLRVMHLAQDETFGMFTGGKVKIGVFRLMCLTLVQCENLRQAILRGAAFAEICRGFQIKQKLSENDFSAQVSVIPISSVSAEDFAILQQQASPVQMRTLLSIWYRLSCWLIGKEIPLSTMYFSFPEPECFSMLVEVYPAKVVFNHPFNGFEFPARFLDYPIVQNQETLMEFLRTAPYQLLVTDAIAPSWIRQVKGILAKDVSTAMPSAEEVAERLNTSVTTLRRRLQAEDTSFQKLKDECRLEAAFHYLGCQDFSNAMIADRLGFDEVSTFFRAFKKWTGITPGEYRKRLTP